MIGGCSLDSKYDEPHASLQVLTDLISDTQWSKEQYVTETPNETWTGVDMRSP